MLGLNAVWTQGPTAATQGRLRLCSGHSQKVLDGRLEVIVSCISFLFLFVCLFVFFNPPADG